jgi:hypothetical protein
MARHVEDGSGALPTRFVSAVWHGVVTGFLLSPATRGRQSLTQRFGEVTEIFLFEADYLSAQDRDDTRRAK